MEDVEVLVKPKKRIEYFDLAKGICITLVVFYHIAGQVPYINDELTSFRMPLYFCLSGIFFKTYDGLSGFLKRKINKLVIPYFFFYLLFNKLYPFVMLEIFGYDSPNSHWNKMWNWLQHEGVGGPVWFLKCLFFMNVIFYLISIVAKNNHYVIGILSLIIGLFGFLFGYYSINIPQNIDSAMTAMPFFYVGYAFYRKTKIFQPNKYDKYVYIITLLLCVILSVTASRPSYLFNKFDTSISCLYSCFNLYVSGITGTLIVLLLSKKINYLPLVSYWGRYSIMILCTHRFIYLLISSVLDVWGCMSFNVEFTFILTMLSYLIIIPFMRKYMPYVTAQKDVIKID